MSIPKVANLEIGWQKQCFDVGGLLLSTIQGLSAPQHCFKTKEIGVLTALEYSTIKIVAITTATITTTISTTTTN